MDSNEGAINIRELLLTSSASQDLDESSPLSAPDLHVLKDRLQVRSLQIKDRVYKYVKSHYQDFSNIISCASNVASEVENISVILNTILKLLDDPDETNGLQVPLDVELCQLVAQRGKMKKDLDEKNEALLLIQSILSFVERLQDAQRGVEQGRLVAAADTLKKLQTALGIPENWKDDKTGVSSNQSDPKAFTLLKTEWVACFTKLQEVLEELLHSAVQIEEENSKLYVNLHVNCGKFPVSLDGIELSSVLTAMDVAGMLDTGFARLADLIIKCVIVPVIHNAVIIIVSKESVSSTESKDKPVLSWASMSDTQTECVAPAALYSKLLEVLRFLHQHICFKNGNWTKRLGRLMWPRISEAVITSCLAKAVPDEASEIAEFQKVVKLTRDFECALKDMMFISASDNQDDRLSNFALNVEVHFASKKKNHILARTRRLIVPSDFSVPLEKSVELLFQPANCAVSWTAKQLMEIVHEALKDACLSPTRIAMEFYQAARDALLLYRAIVPVKLAKQLSSISQAAIIVHNDCLYLAQEILGLAFEYHPNLPNDLKETAVFVDLAPLFHKMADESLNKQIHLVLSGIKEALDQANGFQNIHKKQQSEMASLAMDQVVFLLEKIRMLWQPLLLPTVYKKAICSILQLVFARIGSEILMLDDMAVEETLQLQKLIHTALENLSSLLTSLTYEDMGNRETAEGFQKQKGTVVSSWDQFEKLIPSLHKLRQIADLLDMPLKSITQAWESGELIVSGFSSLEVQKLIRAIFSDTPLRRECLRRIETAEFL